MKPLSLFFISVFVTLNAYGMELTGQQLENPIDTVESCDSLPMVSPYFFQHQYLSVIVPQIREADGYILETPEILNTISANGNGFRSPFSDRDIKVDKIETEGKTVYVWRFPEPEYLREALYMAFIPVDGYYKAFAISIGSLVDWEISTSTESARATYGQVKKPESAQECVELLKDRGALTGEISPGEFLQEGYTAPEYRN